MKGVITIPKAQWEAAVQKLLPSPLPNISWAFDTEFNLIVSHDEGFDAKAVPPIPAVSLPSTVIASVIGQPGHMVTVDPPLSATGDMTMFGLNWNGDRDQADNQEGFFTDPVTGKPYNTGVKTLIGASLPREILMSSFGISDDWLVSLSDAHTGEVWEKHAAAVREFVLSHHVTLTIDSGGLSAQNVALVDAGPEAIGKDGSCIGNLVDATYATAHALNRHGKAKATIELLVNESPIEIKGWNHDTKRVG
jgi:hypothetical protein